MPWEVAKQAIDYVLEREEDFPWSDKRQTNDDLFGIVQPWYNHKSYLSGLFPEKALPGWVPELQSILMLKYVFVIF